MRFRLKLVKTALCSLLLILLSIASILTVMNIEKILAVNSTISVTFTAVGEVVGTASGNYRVGKGEPISLTTDGKTANDNNCKIVYTGEEVNVVDAQLKMNVENIVLDFNNRYVLFTYNFTADKGTHTYTATLTYTDTDNDDKNIKFSTSFDGENYSTQGTNNKIVSFLVNPSTETAANNDTTKIINGRQGVAKTVYIKLSIDKLGLSSKLTGKLCWNLQSGNNLI